MSDTTNPASEAAAAAAAAIAAEPTPAPAEPKMSPLEAALAAYTASNPVDGRKLAEHIAKLQKQFESTKRKASALEEHARVDKDVLRNQLQQLLSHLSPEVTKQFCIDGNMDDQLLSEKAAIARNGFHRVIAACNATFMQVPEKRAAPVIEAPGQAAPKRQRTVEPEPPEAAAMPIDESEVGDAALLRRALAAVYE